MAIIQRDAIWWMHTVVPKFAEPKASDYVSWLVHCHLVSSVDIFLKTDSTQIRLIILSGLIRIQTVDTDGIPEFLL